MMKNIYMCFFIFFVSSVVTGGNSSNSFFIENIDQKDALDKFILDNGHSSLFVLVVDDETTTRRVLERFFANRGYNVILFPQGQIFIESLRAWKNVISDAFFTQIKAVIVDNNMPEILGKEVVKVIHDEQLLTVRDNQSEQGIPLLFNTSDDESLFGQDVLQCVTKKLSSKNHWGDIKQVLDIP